MTDFTLAICMCEGVGENPGNWGMMGLISSMACRNMYVIT